MAASETLSAALTGSHSPEPGARPKVAYVMGPGRSGSTILGIALGNCEGVFYAGELDKWLRRAGDPPLGGEQRERFWRAVREDVEVSPGLTGKVARCLEQSSASFRFGTWRAQRRLRGPYREFAQELYGAVARAANATHVVDTSHFPRRARELQRLDGIDLYLLLIVRDPQSVVASWDRDDVIEPRFTMLQTNAYMWLTYLLSLFVFLRHPRARRLLVRHETFVADPQGTLREILDCIESVAELPDFAELRTGAPFQGNRVARSDVVKLNASTSRPARGSRVTALLQLPWRVIFSLLRPAAGTSGVAASPVSRRRRAPSGMA
jgi:hypothetical protein